MLQKVVGSIPGQSTYRRQMIDVSLTSNVFLFLSFTFLHSKINKNIFLNEDLKKDVIQMTSGHIL